MFSGLTPEEVNLLVDRANDNRPNSLGAKYANLETSRNRYRIATFVLGAVAIVAVGAITYGVLSVMGDRKAKRLAREASEKRLGQQLNEASLARMY